MTYGSCGLDGPQFTVITEQHGRRSVLKLRGELDLCSMDDLRRAVGTALEQHDPQSLTMDLSALTFADCAGSRSWCGRATAWLSEDISSSSRAASRSSGGCWL